MTGKDKAKPNCGLLSISIWFCFSADELYVSAAKVDPSNANVFVHRGILALQARTDIAGARELIQKAIKIDPKCEFAYETLGTLEVIHFNLSRHFVNLKNYTADETCTFSGPVR